MGDAFIANLRDRIQARRDREVAKAIEFGRGIAHLDLTQAKAAAADKYPHDRELQVTALLRGWSAVRHG